MMWSHSASVNNAVVKANALLITVQSSLNSHFKVQETTNWIILVGNAFCDFLCVCACVCACVWLCVCLCALRRLRWTLSYGSCLKREIERAG